MESLQHTADTVRGNLIPKLTDLRRVPVRYYHVLPLAILKKYHCIVIGSAPGVLTVAFTDRHNTKAIEFLKNFTGQSIFPVLIDPARMKLLLYRVERHEYCRKAFCARVKGGVGKQSYMRHSLLRLQVHSITTAFSIQKVKGE
jgi:hypothetical protein